MSDQTIIKFAINGHPESGLVDWEEIPQQIIQSGNPHQRGHEYFSVDNNRFTAGVWDCTAHELTLEPYEVDEFMIVLEGSIQIEDESGNTEAFFAGESFVIPRGLNCSWKQTEYTRKYYAIHDNPSSNKIVESALLRTVRLELSAELPPVASHDETQYLSAVPKMGLLTLYSDPGGEFDVGLWDCGPMKRVASTLSRSELMHILEGSGSITNADGVIFNFSAGDTFLVPTGMGYQWQNDEYVKKIFCSFTPK